MKTKSISLTLFIFFTLNCLSQPNAQYRRYNNTIANIHQYSLTVDDFEEGYIADDYGPRRMYQTRVYRWHAGVDYNSNPNSRVGDLLLSIVEGNVMSSGLLNRNGLKRLIIEGTRQAINQNYVYAHIFQDGTVHPNNTNSNNQMETGGCILRCLDAPYQNSWAIIFQINGNYSAIAPHSTYSLGPPTVTFTNDAGNAITLSNINTQVLPGNPIAPLGTSGGVTAHLHLQLTTNTTTMAWGDSKDPINSVNYTSPNHSMTFLHANDANQGIILDYPGQQKAQFRLELEV